MTTFSLYIHYPFCLHRCPYCGFATQVEQRGEAERYRDRLMRELQSRLAEPPWRGSPITSIYFGGGTPSLMPPEFCSSILQFFNSSIPEPTNRRPLLWPLTDEPTNRHSVLEITLEANPGMLDLEKLVAFKETGINRLSIGAQSFQAAELQLLGRIHNATQITEAVTSARRARFDNLSLDLIYGVPGQTVASFADSVCNALALDIDHLSTYTLSIEPNTPFHDLVKAGTLPAPDPDLMADQYLELCRIMRDAGFEHYELTNFAKPNRWSRHNFAYWQRTPYLGVGLGAHSFDGVRRWWNTRDLDVYLKSLQDNSPPIEGEETISGEQAIEEEIYLALRSRIGLDVKLLRKINPRMLEELIRDGFLEVLEGRIHIPEQNWLLLDEIVLRLTSAKVSHAEKSGRVFQPGRGNLGESRKFL